MKVPADVRKAFGKEILVRSLRTGDHRTAVARLKVAQGEVQKSFEALRRPARSPGRRENLLTGGRLEQLATSDIEALVRSWFETAMQAVRQRTVPRDPEVIDALLEENDEEYAELRSLRPDDFGPAVQHTVHRLLLTAGVPTVEPSGPVRATDPQRWPLAVDPSTPQYRELESLVRRGAVILNRMERARVAPDISIPSDPLFSPGSRRNSCGAGLTLDGLIREFSSDPSRRSMTRKTQLDYGMVFRVLREIIGSETAVTEITRDDCKAVRELLSTLPRNAVKQFPTKTLKQAAEQAETQGLPGLNYQTINSHLNKTSTLFNWAVREERMVKNPAVGLAIEAPEDEEEDGRRSFTVEELRAIFGAPLYTGCKDDERNFYKPGTNKPRRSRFWLPLIALFAGLRQNEIAQLLASDIDTFAGRPIIRVQKTQPWQRLKSKRARRVVPLHPELVRIGFLEYARTVRQSGALLLFPELRLDTRGYMSGSFQKRFGTFQRRIGITDGKASFHSFRHTWRDALRQARVPEERVQAVGGWTGAGQDKRYGNWFERPELVEEIGGEIDRIRYLGLDLSHLYLL